MSAAELPGSPSSPVIGDPFAWSTSASVAYEVALETLGEMVAISAAEIWAEEHADTPDPDRIRRAQQTQARYAGQRRSLRLSDSEESARVTRVYGAILRRPAAPAEVAEKAAVGRGQRGPRGGGCQRLVLRASGVEPPLAGRSSSNRARQQR